MRGCAEEVTAQRGQRNRKPGTDAPYRFSNADAKRAGDSGYPSDIANLAVLDRHHASGGVRVAIMQGSLTDRCAVQHRRHDCRRIIVAAHG